MIGPVLLEFQARIDGHLATVEITGDGITWTAELEDGIDVGHIPVREIDELYVIHSAQEEWLLTIAEIDWVIKIAGAPSQVGAASLLLERLRLDG